jgi:hypothetical protein
VRAFNVIRAAPDVSYEHIDELFTAQVDWDLIATLVPDMMRVAVSIRTGNGKQLDLYPVATLFEGRPPTILGRNFGQWEKK